MCVTVCTRLFACTPTLITTTVGACAHMTDQAQKDSRPPTSPSADAGASGAAPEGEAVARTFARSCRDSGSADLPFLWAMYSQTVLNARWESVSAELRDFVARACIAELRVCAEADGQRSLVRSLAPLRVLENLTRIGRRPTSVAYGVLLNSLRAASSAAAAAGPESNATRAWSKNVRIWILRICWNASKIPRESLTLLRSGLVHALLGQLDTHSETSAADTASKDGAQAAAPSPASGSKTAADTKVDCGPSSKVRADTEALSEKPMLIMTVYNMSHDCATSATATASEQKGRLDDDDDDHDEGDDAPAAKDPHPDRRPIEWAPLAAACLDCVDPPTRSASTAGQTGNDAGGDARACAVLAFNAMMYLLETPYFATPRLAMAAASVLRASASTASAASATGSAASTTATDASSKEDELVDAASGVLYCYTVFDDFEARTALRAGLGELAAWGLGASSATVRSDFARSMKNLALADSADLRGIARTHASAILKLASSDPDPHVRAMAQSALAPMCAPIPTRSHAPSPAADPLGTTPGAVAAPTVSATDRRPTGPGVNVQGATGPFHADGDGACLVC